MASELTLSLAKGKETECLAANKVTITKNQRRGGGEGAKNPGERKQKSTPPEIVIMGRKGVPWRSFTYQLRPTPNFLGEQFQSRNYCLPRKARSGLATAFREKKAKKKL